MQIRLKSFIGTMLQNFLKEGKLMKKLDLFKCFKNWYSEGCENIFLKYAC